MYCAPEPANLGPMCTVVILRRPDHARWPLIIAANRDEMRGRPASPPARHWPDRPKVIAGRDETAGGTWLGVSDRGLVAGVLNRPGSLGPDAAKRSRGELPLEALDHATAKDAADALVHLDPTAYRPFNLFIGDANAAFWLRATGAGIAAFPVPDGLSMLTAHGLDDGESPRARHFHPLFAAAPAPNPDDPDDPANPQGGWDAWARLMASSDRETGAGPEGAMRIETTGGFATVSGSLIALPRPGTAPGQKNAARWLYCPDAPGIGVWQTVS